MQGSILGGACSVKRVGKTEKLKGNLEIEHGEWRRGFWLYSGENG